MPAGIIQEFRAICKKHTKESPYVPPPERGPGSHPNRWKPQCFVIRDLLRNPVFWQEVYELLPKQADGLEVTSVTPQRRSVQQEPLQFYLRELRRLALQTSRAWLACGGVNPIGNVLSHCKCFSRFKP